MSILIFLFILFMLVLVHEWGHFIAAKKTGMRVDEFGIGFPPKLFGIKWGETEYSFNLFPIGGFVKIFGENAIDAVDAPDRGRSFVAKSKTRQSIVLVAGVFMNVLFAWLLFSVALGIGVPTAVDESYAGDTARLMITHILPGSPAEKAGLGEGMIIVNVTADGEKDERLSPASFSAFVESHAESDISVAYTKGNESFVTTLRPELNVIEAEADRPAVGVGLSLIDTVALPIHEAIADGFTMTLSNFKNVSIGILGLLWDALQFKADLSQVAGPVGIVGLVGEASAFGITSLLMFTAFISLNLAVINLFPFPALDGGRLLFVAIEALKGSPMRPKYVHLVNTAGFALLILLMIAVTFNDISKLI